MVFNLLPVQPAGLGQLGDVLLPQHRLAVLTAHPEYFDQKLLCHLLSPSLTCCHSPSLAVTLPHLLSLSPTCCYPVLCNVISLSYPAVCLLPL
eukprot:GFUD01127522.1.p1 GENE.GFUD01127522.1~~GFUD01127522.1.p1  ORF type:complete len:104 (-),score=10.18 GFUD01127522.1:264-542(-)